MTATVPRGCPTDVRMRTLRDRFLLEVDLKDIGTITVSADHWSVLERWLVDLLDRCGHDPIDPPWVPVGTAPKPCFRLALNVGSM